jgi:REP element-mobilizing transposase RayT
METRFFDWKRDMPKRNKRLLPHWSLSEVYTFVTWRLADSLPQVKLQEWSSSRAQWLANHPKPWNEEIERLYDEKFGEELDRWLDSNYGSCVLKDEHITRAMEDCLNYFQNNRYKIIAYSIMPNHVHVLFYPLSGWQVGTIVQGWKSVSAHLINQDISRKGTLWNQEYWDVLIRNELHLEKVVRYILENNHGTDMR